MKQLTIRGFDPELEQSLKRLARREGISMNKAALRLLRKGAELMEPPAIGSRLDRYAGTMSDEEARELLESIAECERIETQAWK